MLKKFTYLGKNYTIAASDSDVERTLHVRCENTKRSLLSLTISHEDAVDAQHYSQDFGLKSLAEMVEADFKRLIDERLLKH